MYLTGDISPVPVSELVDDRSGNPEETQANKTPKSNKKKTTIERGNPCDDSEIPEWLQEFREILVDDEIPLQGGSHANSSHEASLEPRILSCGRMSENHRGPEVPEVKVPAVECHDGLARITLEELAITHFVKNGTLQNACTTRPRVVVGLGKSAHSHIVRLMNSRRKGLQRMMTKLLWLY